MKMLSYDQINEELCKLNFAKKSRMNLKAIEVLYKALQLPDYPKIHIAGTNGKGSCVQKISRALTYSGYKCGSFSSPHVSTFRERIQIDGNLISKQEVLNHVPYLWDLAKSHSIELTFFELVTLLAFKYFADQKVDVAVIEVGLGGRLDATNCIKPILSIITSISLDHEHILGDTLEKIAGEKAGIIKERVPVILGPSSVQQSIYRVAEEKGAKILKTEGTFLSYDDENIAICSKAIDHLKIYFEFKKSAIDKALQERPLCRLEKNRFLEHEVLLDISHNQEGLRRLFQGLKSMYPKRKITVFTSMAFNHDYQKNLKVVQENCHEVYLLDIDHPRLAKAQALLDVCVKGKICNLVDIAEIIKTKPTEELILFTGSIFIMDSIYKVMGKKIEEDAYLISDGIFKKNRL